MVPDIVVPPPPPPPMPSAAYIPIKPTLTIVKSEKSSSPRNPISNSDSFDNVINEIKNKGGTLRKTKRKEVVPVQECFVPQINLKSVQTAKQTFKNEIVVNIVPTTTINIQTDNGTTTNLCSIDSNGAAFKLKRPSDFLSGTKPELPAKKEVLKPQLAPKVAVNGTKSSTNASKPSTISPQRKVSLVSSTIQRLTSTEPDSPTETLVAPFKRNQVLTRSGISSTIQKLEKQESNSTDSSRPTFQRSKSVRQKVDQMNKIENNIITSIKDGTQTVGRRPMVPRPNLPIPRPSNDTMKFLSELNNPFKSKNGNIRLDNEEARVGTTVNVADLNGTVTASDPNVKKLVYGTYRNFLGAYNNKANNVVTNQNGTMVLQDKGVTEQLGKIAQSGNLNNLTGRAVQKTED